jgi:hypothetical protein
MENIRRIDGQEHPDEHLGNLSHRNPDRIEPLGLHSHCHEEVVEIHHGVNTIVHGDEESTRRRVVHVGMPREEKHRNVMIPVKEHKRLLMNHNKEGIKKFTVDE